MLCCANILIGSPCNPHHVTQRGNRRAQTFFEDGDYAIYESLLHEAAEKSGAEVWCYCLMPNHVHISDLVKVTLTPVLECYGDFSAFLDQQENISDAFRVLRQSETTGRLGTDAWVEKLEALTGRQLKPQKRDPKRKVTEDS